MADGDYYARNLAPKWRKVGNTLLGGHEAGVVANLAREAFAETMRLGNGVPGLTALGESFAYACRTGSRDAWLATNEEVRRDAKHHANTEIAVMAGQALLETESDRLSGLSAPELVELLATSTAERIAHHHFAKCRQGALPQSFDGIAALQARERAAMAQLDTPSLAREILRHEDGQGFRAPARPVGAAGTEALLSRRLVGPS